MHIETTKFEASSTYPDAVHPAGSTARVLLTSVFGPYAQDDEYGSRVMNPMELYHNQVTRTQGPFSLRMFHRSWGIMLIQANIEAPCTLLDFPRLERFVAEIREKHYDVVGITSIIPNLYKVRKMCELVRQYQPHAKIVVGGHIANVPDLDRRIDADHVVKGEGVRWFRRYLGEDPEAPIRHPALSSGFDLRVMGVKIPDKADTSATIIASMGCPMGCNFCTTSSFFGGKGKMLNLYSTGEELFRLMEEAEASRNVKSFFIMDENFLLQRQRAMDLLRCMKAAGKSWAFHIFSSANAIRKYSYEELVELGVSSIWLGLESAQSGYAKLQGADTLQLTRELREHGIVLLGSTILGLEHHTPQNIGEEIERAVAHQTDLHQFMLYTPVPGTPLYQEMSDQGRLLADVDPADIHGQFKFNFRHAAISREDSKRFLDWAFWRDFEHNGPSLYRMCQTMLMGWQRYKDYPDPRVRERFTREVKKLSSAYNAALWVMEQEFKKVNRSVSDRIHKLRREVEKEFPVVARLTAASLGPILLWSTRREEKRLAKGRTYEPPTFVERSNWVSAT